MKIKNSVLLFAFFVVFASFADELSPKDFARSVKRWEQTLIKDKSERPTELLNEFDVSKILSSRAILAHKDFKQNVNVPLIYIDGNYYFVAICGESVMYFFNLRGMNGEYDDTYIPTMWPLSPEALNVMQEITRMDYSGDHLYVNSKRVIYENFEKNILNQMVYKSKIGGQEFSGLGQIPCGGTNSLAVIQDTAMKSGLIALRRESISRYTWDPKSRTYKYEINRNIFDVLTGHILSGGMESSANCSRSPKTSLSQKLTDSK